ncbi:MAG: hypothetical protein AABY30_05860 [Candidatus Thermoplasmatota archaeon]
MRPARFLLAAILLAAAVGISAPPARAQWCSETTITVLPPTVAPGSTTTFSVVVWNTGTETTTLTSVEAHFSWEATPRILGAGTVGPTSSETFTVTPTAARSGTTASVQVRVEGFRTNPTTDGDVCTEDVTLAIVSVPDGGLLAAATLWLLLMAVVVVIVVVVIVAVLVVATRKKPQVPPPPPPYAPPPGPPPTPPRP